MKLTSGVFTLFAACAATPTMSSDELGFVHERIRLIGEPEADGAVYIGFELSAKTYWIDAKLSPDAAAMLAFAKSAKDEGRRSLRLGGRLLLYVTLPLLWQRIKPRNSTFLR